MQHGKQPFWARLQLLARLTLNTRNDAANQPARLAQLDDGNNRAILVQGDEDLLKSFSWGIAALHRLHAATKLPFLAARPIASPGPAANGTAVVRRPRPTITVSREHLRLITPPS